MAKQDKALADKLKRLGYPDFETHAGEEEILMLYIQKYLICSVSYALEMSDEQLKALIAETVEVK
jgi:hypothetical protein